MATAVFLQLYDKNLDSWQSAHPYVSRVCCNFPHPCISPINIYACKHLGSSNDAMGNSHSLTGRAKYLESPSSVSFEDEGSQGSLHHSQHLWDGKAGSKQAKGMG